MDTAQSAVIREAEEFCSCADSGQMTYQMFATGAEPRLLALCSLARTLGAEVDRLNSWLSEARKARDEARNERDASRAEVAKLREHCDRLSRESATATRRASENAQAANDARAEVEKLREQVSRLDWMIKESGPACERLSTENEKLRAELEALRATRSRTLDAMRDHVDWSGVLPDEDPVEGGVRVLIQDLTQADKELEALRASEWLVVRAREQDPIEVWRFEKDEQQARAFFDAAALQWSETFLVRVVAGPGNPPPSIPLHPLQAEATRLAMANKEQTALVEQCRPVVEAVMRVKDAKGLQDLHKAQRDLRNLDLTTMPEVKP